MLGTAAGADEVCPVRPRPLRIASQTEWGGSGSVSGWTAALPTACQGRTEEGTGWHGAVRKLARCAPGKGGILVTPVVWSACSMQDAGAAAPPLQPWMEAPPQLACLWEHVRRASPSLALDMVVHPSQPASSLQPFSWLHAYAESEVEGLRQGGSAGEALASPAQAGPLAKTLIFDLCAITPEELRIWQVRPCCTPISAAPVPGCSLAATEALLAQMSAVACTSQHGFKGRGANHACWSYMWGL